MDIDKKIIRDEAIKILDNGVKYSEVAELLGRLVIKYSTTEEIVKELKEWSKKKHMK